MKQECSLVSDLLPLYAEDMLHEDSAVFVKSHLESCPACTAMWARMQSGKKLDTAPAQREDDADALAALRRRIRTRKWRTVLLVAALVALLAGAVRYFPVYRIARMAGEGMLSYYTAEELEKLAYIGSARDRAEAQSILRLGDAAFSDVSHTRAENEAAYGLLARYATNVERGAAYETHTLELWSAHLGAQEGWLWVYYSNSSYRADGSHVSGSRDVASLWQVEKNAAGVWEVVKIREHP